MTNQLFDICCQIVSILSRWLGCTYHEMNTYLFIWLQPALVLLTSLILMFIAVWGCMKRFSVARLLTTIFTFIYTIVCLLGSIILWYHYRIPAHEAGQRAIEEMTQLSEQTGVSYEWINYILFVFGMPGLILLNSLLAWFIYRLYKKKNKH